MKHLLNGVAIAAVLAIAAPAWAQNAPAAQHAPAAMAPKAHAPVAKQRHHRRPARHVARHGKRMHKMTPGDMMTQQLNREELQRIQSGGGMPQRPVEKPPGG